MSEQTHMEFDSQRPSIVEAVSEDLTLYDGIDELKIVADELDEATRKRLPKGAIMQIEGVAGKKYRINRNGRAYGDDVDQAVESLQSVIKERRVVGADGHPKEGYGEAAQQAMLPTGLWVDGPLVRFSADVPATDSGRNVAALIRAGHRYGTSWKGNGDINQKTMDENHPWFQHNADFEGRSFDEVTNFRFNQFQPFDLVIGQSVSDAMTTTFRESATPVTAWELECKMAEKAKELKEVTERAEAAEKALEDAKKEAEEAKGKTVELQKQLDETKAGVEVRAKELGEEFDKKLAEAVKKATDEAAPSDEQKALLDKIGDADPDKVEKALKIVEQVGDDPQAEPEKPVDEKDEEIVGLKAENVAMAEAVEQLKARVEKMESEKREAEHQADLEAFIAERMEKLPKPVREPIAADLRERCKTREDVDKLIDTIFPRYKQAIERFADPMLLEKDATETKGVGTVNGAPPDQASQALGGKPPVEGDDGLTEQQRLERALS